MFAPEGKHTVVFLDSNGQLIESQFVDNNQTVTPPNVDNKSKPGLQVSATTPWRTSTGAVFNPAVGITSNMVIILQYETTVLGTYLMTVNGVEEGPYNFNQLVSVTADAEDLDETPFSHWEENGVMVSRNLEYVFTAVKDRTLTAVYSDTPSADLPLVVLTRDIELRSGYHTYIGQFYLPEGYEIVEYGFLIDNVNTLDLSKSNADYVVPAPSYTEASNEYVMSFPIGSHLNVRAYFTYKVGGSVLTVYSDENPRYIEDVSYQTGFENSTKGGYSAADVTVDGLSLKLSDALIGDLANDRKDGLKSVRVQASGFIQTNTPIDDLYEVVFSVAKYGTDGNATGYVHVSVDNNTWIDVTDALASGITINTTSLVEYRLLLSNSNNLKLSDISPSQPLYVKISKSGGNRVNIDNLSLVTLYKSSTNVVTFNVDDTTNLELVKSNLPISQPSNPTKTGYSFDAWYLEDTFVTPYNFANNVTTDLTLYAKFIINQYTIAFNSNGGSSVTSIEQDYDTDVVEPTSPTKDGYLFDDWYSDVELTIPYVFDKIPSENITLYAKWTLDTYDITYMLDGGTNNGGNPASYTIETSTITLLTATKDGFTFNGWYDNVEFTGEPISEVTLGSFGDITLYAKFTENTGNTFDVLVYDFEGEGNQLLYTIEVAENGFATRPETDPTRAGYRFDDWYLDNAETPFNWATAPITEDITIFGVWVQTFTVTFDSNEGSSVSSQVVDINDYATEPADPTRDGYSFEGWFDITLTTEFIFDSTPVTTDLILYAKWELTPTGSLMIYEVYGGGGNSGATYTNDYVVLYNSTNSSINLTGYSIHYSSATGSFGTTNNLNLSGTIGSNSYYLIQLKAGTTVTNKPLPRTADITGNIDLAGANGKIALVLGLANSAITGSSDPKVIDFLGYGTANDFETVKLGALSNTTSAKRINFIDTNNNFNDFSIGTPNLTYIPE